MSANNLLIWMSARQEGSWPQFRGAVEELHLNTEENDESLGTEESGDSQHELPLYQELRLNMQRLGHAEFFAGAGEKDWRVAPPTLAVTAYGTNPDTWLGVVTGARSQKLLGRISDAAHLCEVDIAGLVAGPDRIRVIAGQLSSLSEFAEHVDMRFQNEAPTSILLNLPPVDDPAVRRAAVLPFGTDWKIEGWSANDLSWKTATTADPTSSPLGLFRYSMGYRRHILLCSRGVASEVSMQVGKYVMLKGRRRHRIIRYDSAARRLSFIASCRPPLLVERALVLCSGSLAEYERGSATHGSVHYTEIPERVAFLTAALLRQNFR